MAKIEANKRIESEWKRAKRRLLVEARREQMIEDLEIKRLAKLEKLKSKSKAQRSTGDEEEEDEADEDDDVLDEVNIDEMLAEELPEEEDEEEMENEESEEEAIERLTEEVNELFDSQSESVEEVLEAFTEIRVPTFQIKASDQITRVRYRLIKKIKSVLVNRQSIFERVYPLKPKEADILVACGFKHLSDFGKWSPVTWMNRTACRVPVKPATSPIYHSRLNLVAIGPLPGTTAEELGILKKPTTCAAVYRENIFWFNSPAERAQFTLNPLLYLNVNTLPLVPQPLRLAVIGPSKSGKSLVAKRMARELGVMHISALSAIKWLIRSPSHVPADTAKNILKDLNQGLKLSNALIAGAIHYALMSPLAQSRGYILDGYPLTAEQADWLFERNVRPILVLQLTARNSTDQVELISRAVHDSNQEMNELNKSSKESRAKDSGEDGEEEEEGEEGGSKRNVQSIEQRFGIPHARVDIVQIQTIKQLAFAEANDTRKAWLTSKNGLHSEIPCTDNQWVTLLRAQGVTTHRMAHIQEYLYNITGHRAASIAELGISPEEFEKNLGEFGYYCPVRLAENFELVDTMHENDCDPEIRLSVTPKKVETAIETIIDPCFLRQKYIEEEDDLLAVVTSKYRFAAEFEGKYYRCFGPIELEKFIANPAAFVSPAAPFQLPPDDKLPKVIPPESNLASRDNFEVQMCLRGYCPVCFKHSGLRYEGLIRGRKEFQVLYDGKIYTFCCNDCLRQFCHKPKEFAMLKLPHKLPPMICPLRVQDLPLPGYLEQTVAYALRTALAICAEFRPKFPFITPERSALIYTALQLKALNPQSSDLLRNRAKRRANKFEDSCRLIEQLAKSMPVRFVDERRRTEKFETRLKKFLSLRGQKDTEDVWITAID